MIVTASLPFGVVKGKLSKGTKISIYSCNSCARVCETGGREKMEEIADRLRKEGFEIVQEELIPMMCSVDLVQRPKIVADEVVSLACISGDINFQTLYPTKKIVPANVSIGFGARDSQGNIFITKKI